MRFALTFLKNLGVDVMTSYFAGLIGSAIYSTISGNVPADTIFLQFLVTLIALQFYRFASYVQGKM